MGTIRLGKRTEGRTPKINEFVPLADLNDIVFGGWDIFEEDCYAAARTAGVLEPAQLDQVRGELEAVKPMPAVFDQRYVKRLDGPNVKKGKNKRDLAEQLIADIRAFKAKHGCDRLVMIWCGSTEVFMKETAAHASLASFEKALEQSDDAIPSSMVYAYAAIREGHSVRQRGAEPDGRHPGDAASWRRSTKSPLAGNDMKTGQTLIKTIIAPGLKARLLGVRGWYSTNILGNRDGEVLDDPESFKTKEESKKSALDYIFQPHLYPELYERSVPRRPHQLLPAARRQQGRLGQHRPRSAGSAIRCSSRSTSCAATASWRRRSCSTRRCSSIWPSAPGMSRHSGVAVVLLTRPDARARRSTRSTICSFS